MARHRCVALPTLAGVWAAVSELSSFGNGVELRQRSVQVEVHFDRDGNGDRMAVFHRRLKSPVLDRLDRFFVQPHSQAGLHVDIAGPPVRSYHQSERANSLVLGLAGFLGELRLGLINRSRRRNASAYA